MGKICLSMPDGYDVYSGVEALREHFDLEAVLQYFRSGELAVWLESLGYEDLVDKVQAIDPNAPDMKRRLCSVLGVDIPPEEDAVASPEEKRARLREKTDDEAILALAAQTAFTQEELMALLNAGEKTIYLCGDTEFSIPMRKPGRKYRGILGTPKINIRAARREELEEKNIVLENVELPNHLRKEPLRVCPFCGETLRMDAKSCDICGASVEAASSSKSNASGNGPDLQELREVFRELSGDEGSDGLWTVLDGDGEEPSSVQKKIILRMVCKDRYTEEDLVHIFVTDDLSLGWALTSDAVCVSDSFKDMVMDSVKGDGNEEENDSGCVKYRDIEKVVLQNGGLGKRADALVVQTKGNRSWTFNMASNDYAQKLLWTMGQFLDYVKGK